MTQSTIRKVLNFVTGENKERKDERIAVLDEHQEAAEKARATRERALRAIERFQKEVTRGRAATG